MGTKDRFENSIKLENHICCKIHVHKLVSYVAMDGRQIQNSNHGRGTPCIGYKNKLLSKMACRRHEGYIILRALRQQKMVKGKDNNLNFVHTH